MELLQVQPDEFDIVFDILRENAQWLEEKDIVQWPLEWLDAQKESIKEAIRDQQFVCFKKHGEIICVAQLISEPEAIWQFDPTPSIYVHKLAVRRHLAGSQLGQKMLKSIRQRGIDMQLQSIRLDCVAHNHSLRHYYERNGFHLQGEVETPEITLALYDLPLTAAQ